MKENLPLELLNKHRESLGLKDPAVFDNENRLFEERPAPASGAIVFLPKSKALINMTLALVSEKVAADGVIVLAGANDAGIRSAKDSYEKYIGPVDQKIVGNHSALYVGHNKKLSAGKTWRDFLSFFSLSYGVADKAVSIEVANIPGVFSAGELDAGTKLLLDTISYDKTAVLDVGSGAGAVGAIYKKKNPAANITMCDKSLLAVKASEETIKKNALEAHIVHSDVFDGIDGRFDLILCNPPFHTGIETNYSFIERFARDAKAHLNRGGQVYIVANSFLPYERVLEKGIGPTEMIADNGKFKILMSRA
ncbi:MAG TPA: class I SAM-dependent methyltransferase [Candidatus Paceibacterota bacterium]|jgi:16S rRNA (guanine1207-N2)-methyltransferase|nr:class I SAM-dependent methyltransferase [Candidatus Paceibacterota bacterium]